MYVVDLHCIVRHVIVRRLAFPFVLTIYFWGGEVYVRGLGLGRRPVKLFAMFTQTNMFPSQNDVVDRPWVFRSWVRISPPTNNKLLPGTAFPHHVGHDNTLPVYPENETARILTRPPVYAADPLSRDFKGGECYNVF